MKEFRTVKKLKLTIVADTKEEREEKYKFIRDSQYAQYQGLNFAILVEYLSPLSFAVLI